MSMIRSTRKTGSGSLGRLCWPSLAVMIVVRVVLPILLGKFPTDPTDRKATSLAFNGMCTAPAIGRGGWRSCSVITLQESSIELGGVVDERAVCRRDQDVAGSGPSHVSPSSVGNSG